MTSKFSLDWIVISSEAIVSGREWGLSGPEPEPVIGCRERVELKRLGRYEEKNGFVAGMVVQIWYIFKLKI
jgi:hypothetical protein